MIHDHRHLLDWLVWLSAGVAALSLNTALGTIALCISIILGCFRVHDRIKYGPVSRGRDDD